MTAEKLQKRLSNESLQTQDFRKQESILKHSNWVETMLVASHCSRNKFLVTEADFKVS